MERDSIPFSFEKFVERAREMQATKRDLLSLLAVLFDPLGLISPMLVRMKMLFQTLCCEKWDWDKELEGESRKKFSEWVEDLSEIKGISISQCVYEIQNKGFSNFSCTDLGTRAQKLIAL